MSSDLKAETKRDYQNMQIECYPKPSNMSYNQPVDREDIVVDLAVRPNTDSCFNVKDSTEGIAEIRQKHKEDASKTFDHEGIVLCSDECVIITGVPGSGKTTFIETLLYKWAVNKLWEEKFDFVFIIHLRKLVRFKSDQEVTSHKILSEYYPTIFEIVRKAKDPNTLLIMDGFDELYCKGDLVNPEKDFTSCLLYTSPSPRDS